MKLKLLQINWHNQQPVFSLDFNERGELATAGADKEVKYWKIVRDEGGEVSAEFLSSLSAHSKSVNAVRFAPTGDLLASAGDAGEIVLWREKFSGEQVPETPVSTWKAIGTLRGQAEDVQDLAWSPDGTAVMTGSVENVAMVWDIEKQKALSRLDGHRHYIQGVAWDPLGEYMVTQSGDRSCRIYTPKPKRKVLARGGHIASRIQACGISLHHIVAKTSNVKEEEHTKGPSASADGVDDDARNGKKQKVERTFLFHDETMPSFFRRLSWSPDGSFIAIPAGLYKRQSDAKHLGNCLHIFKRGHWSSPVLTLPALSKAVVAVRFCPIFFKLEKKEENNAEGDSPFCLPYAFVFAVATTKEIILYHTESKEPIGLIGGIHLSSITDLAWCQDKYLAVSSHDGFCSIISFKDGELGTPLENAPRPTFQSVPPAAAESEKASKSNNEEDVKSPQPQNADTDRSKHTEGKSENNNSARRRITPSKI